eukprot:747684-Amphidinium_carterae.1
MTSTAHNVITIWKSLSVLPLNPHVKSICSCWAALCFKSSNQPSLKLHVMSICSCSGLHSVSRAPINLLVKLAPLEIDMLSQERGASDLVMEQMSLCAPASSVGRNGYHLQSWQGRRSCVQSGAWVRKQERPCAWFPLATVRLVRTRRADTCLRLDRWVPLLAQ